MDLHQLLQQYFGYKQFRGEQEQIIQTVLKNKAVLIVMPTGGGKSLCYQLPALMMEGTALVISPLISLMKDQVDGLIQRGISATYINSTLPEREISDRLYRLSQREYKFLYAAPERLKNKKFLNTLQNCNICLVAVDEAHCISEWGHQFRPDYRKIKMLLTRLNNPSVIAATATATEAVRQDILHNLGIEKASVFISGFERKNIVYVIRYFENEMEKLQKLQKYVKQGEGCGIIYCSSRKMVEMITRVLQPICPHVFSYHAGMEESVRQSQQEHFMRHPHAWMVATNAFGMGIDKPDIRYVIHFHIPGTMESFYQESGRGGRDGKQAYSIILYSPEDRRLRRRLIDLDYPDLKVIEKVYQVVHSCKEQTLYLNQIQNLVSPLRVSTYEIYCALQLLEKNDVLQFSPARFSEEEPYDVTIRNKEYVCSLDHKYTEILKRKEEKGLEVLLSWVESGECRGIGILQYFGESIQKSQCGHCDVCLGKRDPSYQNIIGNHIYSESLFYQLKQERKRAAGLLGISEFIIANNQLLKELCRSYPQSKEELEGIVGIGKRNWTYIESYLLPIIKEYVSKYPDEIRNIKNKVIKIVEQREKSSTKELKDKILTLYLNGKTLEEIAVLCQRKMSTIEEYIARLMEEYPIDLELFVSFADQQIIQKVLEKNSNQKLKNIKNQLPSHIQYSQIKYVIAALKRNHSPK